MKAPRRPEKGEIDFVEYDCALFIFSTCKQASNEPPKNILLLIFGRNFHQSPPSTFATIKKITSNLDLLIIFGATRARERKRKEKMQGVLRDHHQNIFVNFLHS